MHAVRLIPGDTSHTENCIATIMSVPFRNTMFMSAGHTGIARAKEVPIALFIPLILLSCDVLTYMALMSTGPGVVGEASGSHDGLTKIASNQKPIVRHCKCEQTLIAIPSKNLDACHGTDASLGS